MLRIATSMNFSVKVCCEGEESLTQAKLSPYGVLVLRNSNSSLYVKYDLISRSTEETTPQFSVIDLNLFRVTQPFDKWILSGVLEEDLSPGIGKRIHSIMGIHRVGQQFLTCGRFWTEIQIELS